MAATNAPSPDPTTIQEEPAPARLPANPDDHPDTLQDHAPGFTPLGGARPPPGTDACIGMRLHFLVFAALARRPAVAIDAGPKVASFAAETGIRACPPGARVAALSAALAIARPPEPDAVAAMRRRAEAALDDIAAGLLPAPTSPPRRGQAGSPLASVR
jgi:hypothetical protein